MAEKYLPGAKLMLNGDDAPTDGGPAKAIAHITWDRNATASKPAPLVPYKTLQDYFGKNAAGKAAAPHILWNPFTGEFTQFYPATSRSKSVADQAGGTRTNRAGSVVIQIEALFFPYCEVDGKVYAKLTDTPMKGWDKLHAWVKSHGVPDVWPMGGAPTSFKSRRNESTWEKKGGWYAHADVPENDHTDPGSWPAFPTGSSTPPATPGTAKPKVSVAHLKAAANKDPGAEQGHTTYAAEVKLYEAALVKLRFLDAQWADGSYGTKTLYATSALQKHLGYKGSVDRPGSDADGRPGMHSTTWLGLRSGLFTAVA